ncbi:MAG: hypothetical protein ACLFP9_08675 [Desulfonatronovibrio sp.]
MKLYISFLIISLVMICSVSARENDLSGLSSIEEEMESIRQEMDELAKNESDLRDRQTTRIIKIEEDLEAIRQELAGRIEDVRQTLSSEQSVLREYIEIINTNITSLEAATEENETNLQPLASRLKETDQDLSSIRQELEKTDERIAGLDNTLEDFIASTQARLSEIGDVQQIEKRVSDLTSDISNTRSDFKRLNSKVEQELEGNLDRVRELEKDIQQEITEISQKITNSDQGVMEEIRAAQSRISQLDKYVGQRELYGTGALLGLGALLLLVVLLVASSRKRIKKTSRQLADKEAEIRQKIEEQGAMLDSRLVELLEKQIPLLPSSAEQSSERSEPGRSEWITDHTLAIVLGNEIYRLKQRGKKLPEQTQGVDELRTSLQRLWAAFKEQGYEVIDLQDKKYHEDMEARAEFVLTHELLPGEQIVSRVIKPLIKHKGVTIQEAEIEVQVGE